MSHRAERDREAHHRAQMAGAGPYRIKPAKSRRRKTQDMTKNLIVMGIDVGFGPDQVQGVKMEPDGTIRPMTQEEIDAVIGLRQSPPRPQGRSKPESIRDQVRQTVKPAAKLLAPPGDCDFCDARRTHSAAAMKRSRAKQQEVEDGMARMRYFGEHNGETVQFAWISHIPNKEFDALFPGVKGKRSDSFSKWVGYLDEASKTPLPLLRTIEFKNHPSLHKCDARCQHAKGHQCECSCGGKNHGAGG